VPHGSVYYFYAVMEILQINWRKSCIGNRVQIITRKGFGYGFVSFDVKTSEASADIAELAKQLFKY
jgi:hypothetical protein